MTRGLVSIGTLALVLGFAACGGSKPPAESPKTETAPTTTAPETKAEPKEEPKKDAEPAGETKVEHKRKPAKDFLLASGWEFTLSFADSDLKAKAEETCKKKTKDKEDATRECVSKAGSDAANDRLKIVPDDKGGQWLIYMGKVGGKEVIYTKLPIKVEKEETDKLVLKPTGKDQGKQAMKKVPETIELQMPDEYSVVMQHPDKGKLVFAVKVSAESTEKTPPPKPEKGDKAKGDKAKE